VTVTQGHSVVAESFDKTIKMSPVQFSKHFWHGYGRRTESFEDR